MTRTFSACAIMALMASPASAAEADYDIASEGTRVLESARSDLAIRILVEQANLGSGEVEVGEITFPAGYESGGHAHGAIEIFYVLSGTLHHVVNGEERVITPGMVGVVRAGDEVVHKVPGDQPCRAVVIWAPGGEADRLARFFQVRLLD